MKKAYYFAIPFAMIGIVFIIIGVVNEDADQMRYGFLWFGVGLIFIIYHIIKKK